MEIGSLLFILAIAIFVVAFVTLPLLQKGSVSITPEEQALSGLIAERERIFESLEELEFDHGLGKIPEEIYPSQRSRLMAIGAEVLRQIDEVKDSGGDYSPEVDKLIENMIETRRGSRKTGKICPKCRKGIHFEDHFCANCGTVLR